MTAQTPGCGSTSDARKRAAEAAPSLYDALTHHGRAYGASTGETVAEGIIVAVADRPTYVLITETGERFHWMAHLVDVADEATEEEYAARVDLLHPPGTIFGQPAAVANETPAAEPGGLRKALDDLLDQWESQHSHLGVERGNWGPSSSSLRALLAAHSTEGGADRG